MRWLLGLIPTVWRLVAVAALVASIGGFLVYERHKIMVEGATAELQKIEKANAVEQGKADAGSAAVDGCSADGRVWDRVNGVCGDVAR